MEHRTLPAPGPGTDPRLSGQLPGAEAPAILAALRDAAGRFELPAAEEGGTLTLSFGEGGRLSATARAGGVALEIAAGDERGLYRLQQVALMVLDRAGPGIRPVWSRQWTGQRPPSLIEARLAGIRQISPRFRRVRLESADFGRWGPGALHFRFLLPPVGREPVWPQVDDSGRTQWPAGADAIHRPVYTVRAIDPQAGWADVDVFVHDGGRVTRWTEEARPGAPVGLMGPAGKALPAAERYALFADETGLPAVARHLAALPAGAQGQAVLLADPADRQDLAAPAGFGVTWLDRAAGESLTGALAALDLPPGCAGWHVWFAGEKAEADRARTLLHDLRGLDRKRSHVTAYWHQSAA